MSNIQSLLESANPWKTLQSEAGKLATKWSETGLLEGLKTVEKNNMALMLENQAKQLVIETNTTSAGSGAGTFTVGQSENWAGIALPLVRKVFGQIAAKEFVSVQPMDLPSGLVFFLDFQYGNTKTPFNTGESIYGQRNPAGQFPFASTAISGGLYGTGRFTYATNNFSASQAVSTSAGGTGNIVSASLADINFDSTYSASIAAGGIKKITITASRTALPDMDPDAVRGFIITSGSGVVAATNLQQFTEYNYTANTIDFYVTASTALAASGSYVIIYNKATADNYRGDFEASTSGSFSVPNSASTSTIVIPEINVKMQSQSLTAKTKKLKASWTPEFATDLNAYQNLDAEAELTNFMSEYISMEIDLEILEMLMEDAAAGNEYWSTNNNQVINATNTAFVASTSAYYNTQGEWFQTLGTKIQKLSNKIHQLTLRGGANFIVTSPTVATVLESIPGFASNNNGSADQMEYAFGVQKAGQLNGRYTIYKNPYITENIMLCGYRGSQFLEAGAVFAPYIPIIMTPLVYDPETLTPTKGLLTRFAKKMLRPEYYGRIYIEGLNTI